ncbi:hypothetical protein FHS82_000743 [Pseudochelatococcus lubricantis]|uniref:Uncharacterized protein n=1 Tax=Pseudochelatococcus lubricantis TaxID=1538102 RepID=A0ABX0UYD0_9HYPH|nr:hypothetical protein [Pseudochelatococcus lubricantis]NIJ56930.1 hypothetical protein [Pseudochelatococcus lubricantis]
MRGRKADILRARANGLVHEAAVAKRDAQAQTGRRGFYAIGIRLMQLVEDGRFIGWAKAFSSKADTGLREESA